MEKVKKVLDRIFIEGLSAMAHGLFAPRMESNLRIQKQSAVERRQHNQLDPDLQQDNQHPDDTLLHHE